MATTSTSRLVCKFKNLEGKAVNKSFNYAKADVTDAQVNTLMNSIIAKGDDVFNDVPKQKVSAQVVTTTTKDLEVED